MIDKVKELMTQPERIRNIAIAAHIDHGKCVSGKTRIMLADGRFETAESLFQRIANNNRLVHKDSGKAIFKSDGIIALLFPSMPVSIQFLSEASFPQQHQPVQHIHLLPS